jgi:hypothetical protein
MLLVPGAFALLVLIHLVIYVPCYVMHECLPTHSMGPTRKHSGIGSAIVTKCDMVASGLLEA